MKKQIYSAIATATFALQPDDQGMATLKSAVKRTLLALAILGVAGTSSGCLWVHDDDGHHHWRWHHDHDDHYMDHHDHD